mmetsp:Transcript_30624/g.81467  ORF Transcript_30624/g.81467 Transcript_30624/m.81467 type:complete len:285 (+) Transcript_30624:617-1471(+)
MSWKTEVRVSIVIRVLSSSFFILKSMSMLAVSMASFTNIALITFIIAKNVMMTYNKNIRRYPTEISKSSLTTSHQSRPPNTAMMSVSMLMGSEPKNVPISSTYTSVSDASSTYAATASKKITAKKKTTRIKKNTAHINMVLQWTTARVRNRSWATQEVKRTSRRTRRERRSRAMRKMRTKLGLKANSKMNSSATEVNTTRVSNAFHLQSDPATNSPSEPAIRMISSPTKTISKMTARIPIQGLGMKKLTSAPCPSCVFKAFLTEMSPEIPRKKAFRKIMVPITI